MPNYTEVIHVNGVLMQNHAKFIYANFVKFTLINSAEIFLWKFFLTKMSPLKVLNFESMSMKYTGIVF